MLPKSNGIRILEFDTPQDIAKIMGEIKADPYGVKIMAPKAESRILRINRISNISANILKQEMLSLGGDAAVSRGALTGNTPETDCLLIGDLASLTRLTEKLQKQPFGLNLLAGKISQALKNYRRDDFFLSLGGHKLNLGRRTHIMGIVNTTPDSFSGDGLLNFSLNEILGYAEALVRDGADIIDVGGESSRPGAIPVSVKEELKRVIPVIRRLAKKIKAPISVDTRKPEVAHAALDSGASMVNDITGLRDRRMLKTVSRHNAAVVIMHMKGTSRTMQQKAQYSDIVGEIVEFLKTSIGRAMEAGVNFEKIVIDPGIGFAKTLEDNLTVLKHLKELKVLGRPILVGTSRKSFIGKLLNNEPQDRIFGTISSCILAAKSGARILRAHDAAGLRQALRVFDAVEAG